MTTYPVPLSITIGTFDIFSGCYDDVHNTGAQCDQSQSERGSNVNPNAKPAMIFGLARIRVTQAKCVVFDILIVRKTLRRDRKTGFYNSNLCYLEDFLYWCLRICCESAQRSC